MEVHNSSIALSGVEGEWEENYFVPAPTPKKEERKKREIVPKIPSRTGLNQPEVDEFYPNLFYNVMMHVTNWLNPILILP